MRERLTWCAPPAEVSLPRPAAEFWRTMEFLLACVALGPVPDEDAMPAADVPRAGLLPGAGGLVTRLELSSLTLWGGPAVWEGRRRHRNRRRWRCVSHRRCLAGKGSFGAGAAVPPKVLLRGCRTLVGKHPEGCVGGP